MIITAPNQFFDFRKTSVFLAGTIDNGNCVDWQVRVTNIVQERFPDVVLYNPRRPDWNPEATDTDILEQIRWEQNYLEKCDIVFFNFLPDSKSPITLLELGQCLGRGQNVVVVCPKTFYRHLNVRYTSLISGKLIKYSEEDGIAHLFHKLECILT